MWASSNVNLADSCSTIRVSTTTSFIVFTITTALGNISRCATPPKFGTTLSSIRTWPHLLLTKSAAQSSEAFVYDISGIPAAAGVTRTNDPAGCEADLIISSNVLEHVGFPRLLVSEILKAAPKEGLVYLEVPCEFVFGLARISRRLAQIGVMALTRPALAQYIIRPASLYMMHEHINYFTERSLIELMRSCGGSVIAAGSYFSSGRAGKSDMAWCIGSKT